jgi:hypothetical protein
MAAPAQSQPAPKDLYSFDPAEIQQPPTAWVIVLSCLIKPAMQAEIGVNWIVWGWTLMISMTRFQIGTMFGGVSQVLNQIFPPCPWWPGWSRCWR